MQFKITDYTKFKQTIEYKTLFNNSVNMSPPYNLKFHVTEDETGLILTFNKYFYSFNIFRFAVFKKEICSNSVFIKSHLVIFVLVDLYNHFKMTNLLKVMLQGCVYSPYQLKLFYNDEFHDISNIYIYNFELLRLSTNTTYDGIYAHANVLNKPLNGLQLRKINKTEANLSYIDFFGTHTFTILIKDIIVVAWILLRYYDSPKLLIMLLNNGICEKCNSHFYLKLMKY